MTEQDAGLRARLVRVGVDLVTTEGLSALSLREIARRAGVSHGAPRRYFPTHLALLSAIAREGFADLTARVTAALGESPGHPFAQLTTLGRQYVEFGRTNRGMFELMFRHDLLESNQFGLRETSLPLFRLLVEIVDRARPGSTVPVPVIAGALWANLHGIVQLWNWGSLPLATGSDDVEPLLRAALDAHLGPRPR
ncbi:TetR/AcrR family transcriptional regulator [Planosporangium mesophilum]|uniref:TetR family transcriptional regulator n=1 Tax=Planosporangium mesophilum TaxID=689768 RepID=A0A8J3X1R7_9ACTN|nr:TetR/AcrR family transcriptional regulator [Planosporangium mesophilum]NJC85408.1 TetR/AcrR family transcriptional regulator [Planosporangium mesophilum]GII24081.1 TetR family transcriptional regulator [Planosporangium mesophilum]